MPFDSVVLPYTIKNKVIKGINPYICQSMDDVFKNKKLLKEVVDTIMQKNEKKFFDTFIKQTNEKFTEFVNPANKIYEDVFNDAFFEAFDTKRHEIISNLKKKEDEARAKKEAERKAKEEAAIETARIEAIRTERAAKRAEEEAKKAAAETKKATAEAEKIEMEAKTAELKAKTAKMGIKKAEAEIVAADAKKSQELLDKEKTSKLIEEEKEARETSEALKQSEQERQKKLLEKRLLKRQKNVGGYHSHKKTHRAIRQNRRRTRAHRI